MNPTLCASFRLALKELRDTGLLPVYNPQIFYMLETAINNCEKATFRTAERLILLKQSESEKRYIQ